MNQIPFVYSAGQSRAGPLDLYLPSHRPGSTQAWLEEFALAGQLILSPFGSSPQVITEAARAGCRILVPAHNPILRFLIERLADPVPREDLNSSLVRLASSFKGEQRIKPLILSLYETECPQCGAVTSAQSFSWSREQGLPVQKTCSCTACGEETRGPVSGQDLAKAAEHQANSPSHARALTRVSAPDDPVMLQVEIALRSYPPRAVYALLTLFNKLTGLALSPAEKTHLEMLLLYAFYRSSSPETRIKAERREGSAKEDLYLEENVWFSLEQALDVWSSDLPRVPCSIWPELPPAGGGICLFLGRARELVPQLQDLPIQAVVMVFPRPSLSLWALSALWTGWLWGQEAAAPLRSILSARTFDWPWIARAISSTLAELQESLPPGIPYLGSLPDLNPDYLLTSLTSASQAGLHLEGLALETDQRAALSTWRAADRSLSAETGQGDRELIREAGLSLLKGTGEPQPTLHLYAAGLLELSGQGSLRAPDPGWDPDVQIPRLAKDFEENIAYRKGFLHYARPGNWWHQDLVLGANPSSDQVEQSLVNLLVSADAPLAERDLVQGLYRQFPGLSTPRQGLVRACLDSYAERISLAPPAWKLNASDLPDSRKSDLQEIQAIIHQLGLDLGFAVASHPPLGGVLHLSWGTEVATHFNFFISASGLLSKILAGFPEPPKDSWIILPGSRAGLIHYKMEQNPPLEDLVKSSFGLVKFRHIRRLAEQGGLTHANLKERLAQDPFKSESPQLQLI